MRIQKDYIVNSGSTYDQHTKNMRKASRQYSMNKDLGTGFLLGFKAHDEVSRIRQGQAAHPIMSYRTRSSFRKSSQVRNEEELNILKKLERNFHREQIKGRSCWSQLKPVDTS